MKLTRIIFILIILLLITGCQNTGNPKGTHTKENEIPGYNSSPDDIVEKNGDIVNKERFERFINNIEKGKNDSIRVVRYTTEGDPMLRDLEYNGETIIATSDTQEDNYGKGSTNATTCTSIEVIDSTERTDYLLDGCESFIDTTILVIEK